MAKFGWHRQYAGGCDAPPANRQNVKRYFLPESAKFETLFLPESAKFETLFLPESAKFETLFLPESAKFTTILKSDFPGF